MKTFIINNSDGKIFSKKSGDFNKIHIDEKYAYNSQFGEPIVHGSLIIIKILKNIYNDVVKTNNKKVIFNFNILNYIKYNTKLNIIKKNAKTYLLIGNKKKLIKLDIQKELIVNKTKKVINKKKIFINLSNKSDLKIIIVLLMKLSKYVGMDFPGENSLIKKIVISNNSQSKYNFIQSWQEDKRIPIIKNELFFRNIYIYFETLIRPSYKEKNIKLNNQLKKNIKNLDGNFLIIGASMGIGKEVLKILSYNKKIKIYASYYKNKLEKSHKNLKILKIDISKDLTKIKKLILKKDFNVYYFATPKIFLDKNNKDLEKHYYRYYVKNAVKILKIMKKSNKKYNFFYPSTEFIDSNKEFIYSKIKLIAEKILSKEIRKFDRINLNILRIPRINTKQNLSIFKNTLPTFTQLINENNHYQKKLLFQ